ncbi:hypothetical protein EGD75_21545 [Escherichia coli]|nr:hypothetical protein [Escherichia coli]
MMPVITGTANERHVFLNAVNGSLLSGVAAHAPCNCIPQYSARQGVVMPWPVALTQPGANRFHQF